MYDDELLNRIRDYFRQNQGTYTVEALRERMIRDGAPPEAVDRVIAEMQPAAYLGPPPGGPPSQPGKPMRASTVLLVIVAGVVVNLAIAGGALALAVGVENGWPFLICPLAFVAEIVGAVMYGRRNPSVTVGLVIGLVVTPIVAVILLLGACFAIIYSMNGRIAG